MKCPYVRGGLDPKRSGFHAGFIVETSLAGTFGFERSRLPRTGRVGPGRAGCADDRCCTSRPLHGGVFDIVESAQWPGAKRACRSDGFGLEQIDRRLGRALP